MNYQDTANQMNFTTLSNGETKLSDGTYRVKKGDLVSPATVSEGRIRFLLNGVTLDGKVSYKKM